MNPAYFERRDRCPGCGSADYRQLFSCPYDQAPISELVVGRVASGDEPLRGATFELAECSDCTLVWQVETPNERLASLMYDAEHGRGEFQRHDYLEYYSALAQEIIMIVGFFARPPSDMRILDFGMGWGRWARMAKAFGCEAFGTEISEQRIDYARAHGVTSVGWDEIPGGGFDFVNAEQIFEHLAHPLETLAHLKDGLAQDGVIKISTPDGADLKRRLKIGDWRAPKGSGNSLSLVEPLLHVNCFRRKSLLVMGDRVDLEPILIPMSVQFASGTNWRPGKPLLKNLARPIYRNVLKRGAYLLLRRRRS